MSESSVYNGATMMVAHGLVSPAYSLLVVYYMIVITKFFTLFYRIRSHMSLFTFLSASS
jgi:hypothetical protein